MSEYTQSGAGNLSVPAWGWAGRHGNQNLSLLLLPCKGNGKGWEGRGKNNQSKQVCVFTSKHAGLLGAGTGAGQMGPRRNQRGKVSGQAGNNKGLGLGACLSHGLYRLGLGRACWEQSGVGSCPIQPGTHKGIAVWGHNTRWGLPGEGVWGLGVGVGEGSSHMAHAKRIQSLGKKGRKVGVGKGSGGVEGTPGLELESPIERVPVHTMLF